MAFVYYTSEDESAEVGVDTSINKVTINDLDSESGAWSTPITNEDDVNELDSALVPGFKNGSIMMLIGKLIKKALT